ncbi:MAG: carboxypeptidase-like regulatory domain-containing protein, partial [Candidatus Acidiferrales bacterium]
QEQRGTKVGCYRRRRFFLPILCLMLIWASRTTAQTETNVDAAANRTGSITGTVLDATGAVVSGASAFHLTVTSPGFVTQTSAGTLTADEAFIVPPVMLPLAEMTMRITVLPQEQIAEREIKQEEQQRVLRVFPNFYVTYFSDAVPLPPKQKFELAWKTTVDPVTFAITAGVAGVEQAQNSFSGYGGGAQGYGRRFGAFYADTVTGTFIGSAILPSLLKQDPRYFYKGSGSIRSRVLYAIANAVICRGDNLRWQPNYSNILGGLAAGGISNLYYPRQNRDGAELTFESALINIGAGAATNVLQEFFVRKFTPKLPRESNAVLLKLRRSSPALARASG